jgi:drug/metabolite transporter (DMT)-like permease
MYSKNERPPIPPRLGLLLGILAASSAAIFIRYAQQEAPSLVIAASRLGIASMILAMLVLPRSWKEIGRLRRTQVLLMVLSGVFLALHFATWITSLEYTSVASSVVLVTTSPLWVALLSPIFLKEKINRMVGIGLAVSLVGSIIIEASQACALTQTGIQCEAVGEILQGKGLFGNLLSLAGAWFAAFYLVVGRKVRSDVSLRVYTLLVYGTAAVVLAGLVLVFQQKVTGYSPQTYLLFLGLALVPQLMGHSLFNWALKYVSAAFVSIALLGEPIGSSILALILLSERPTLLEVGGGTLILAGIYLASQSDRNLQRE